MRQVFLAAAAGVVLASCGCGHVWPTSRAAVTYQRVEALPTDGSVAGTSLTVEIELAVDSPMPHVAPHVIVSGRCDGRSDEQWAFFQALDNADSGDIKIDHAELFRVSSFVDGPPRECQLVISLSEGATQPQHYCYRRGYGTRPGRCS